MKKVASIFAVAVFTVGLFATQLADNNISLADLENAIACGDCDTKADNRGENS